MPSLVVLTTGTPNEGGQTARSISVSKTTAPGKGLKVMCLEGEAPQFVLSSLVHEEVIRLYSVYIHSMCMHLHFYIYVQYVIPRVDKRYEYATAYTHRERHFSNMTQ